MAAAAEWTGSESPGLRVRAGPLLAAGAADGVVSDRHRAPVSVLGLG